MTENRCDTCLYQDVSGYKFPCCACIFVNITRRDCYVEKKAKRVD